MSTLSREDNGAMSSEDSSSPDESELELGLGLSLGCGFNKGQQGSIKGGHYARVFTAKDLGSVVSSSTSSSSSTLSRSNGTAGVKRSADSVSAPNGASRYLSFCSLFFFLYDFSIHTLLIIVLQNLLFSFMCLRCFKYY